MLLPNNAKAGNDNQLFHVSQGPYYIARFKDIIPRREVYGFRISNTIAQNLWEFL